MKKTKNFNISVPELGDKPDITQVSNAIQDLEDALAGTLEVMNAEIQGTALTLTSGARTTKRTKYYEGMAIKFIAPIQINPNSLTTVTVDGLSQQTLEIPYLINAGDSADIVYIGNKFIATMTAIQKSNAIDSLSDATVGTSLAVKKAYDKGVEALNQANEAKSTAETMLPKGGYEGTAQTLKNNIDSKVSKNGDTMTGDLFIPEHSLQAKNVIAKQSVDIYTNGWLNFNYQNQGVGWMIGEHGPTGYLKFLKTDNGVGSFELMYLKPDNSLEINSATKFNEYINANSTINARTEGSSKIMSRGIASSYSESARSNSGFHVGQDGIPLIVSNTTSTFTKGYQIETVTNELGYVARTSIGHLRSGGADWGSTVIYFEGDAAGQEFKTWSFDHKDGRFNTQRLTVIEESQFNTAIYSSATSMLMSNVTGMHLHSNNGLIGFLSYNAGWVCHADNYGNFTAMANITAFSDAKLKKDLEVIPNAVEKIQAISGYTYTRKDTGERQAGVIAQEIQKVLPEVVLSNKDEKGEETLSVAYGNIVALLIEGIKEQQNKIDSLEKRLSKLEKMLEVV